MTRRMMAGSRPGGAVASRSLREAFRYVKERRVRVYFVRGLPDAAELWIATGTVGRMGDPARRFRLPNAEDLPVLLDDVELTLRQSGWTRVSP